VAIVAAPALAAPHPVKAAVLRSQGTQFTIGTWRYLNSTWPQFGDTPVEIDYWSLAGYHWTLDQIAATDADVLIFSCPGYNMYFAEEIQAVSRYVQAGHGLIITYGNFRSEDRALAPLVGISTSIALGTGTSSFPIEVSALMPEHPLFDNMHMPYTSAVRYVAHTSPLGPWPLEGGTIVADLFNGVGSHMPSVIIRDAGACRGVYFSYYIELGNEDDMHLLYNALVWVPEPGTVCFLLAGAGLIARRHRRADRRR